MLIRSLATAQYKCENSYQLLITHHDWINDELAINFGDDRQPTGVIYVSKPIDTPSNLAHYKYLHKIGFSTLTGEARTKHSIRGTAFLQQPVISLLSGRFIMPMPEAWKVSYTLSYLNYFSHNYLTLPVTGHKKS